MSLPEKLVNRLSVISISELMTRKPQNPFADVKWLTVKEAQYPSLIFQLINNACVGAHPMVSRPMKGIFNLYPAVPRYTKMWDISVVLKYLNRLSPAPHLSLKKLTLKLIMIMIIMKASRAD